MSDRHVAFVTGGGRGIGAAIAQRLARDGVAVAVAARSQDDCFGVVDAIREEGGTAAPVYLDVSDRDSIAAAVEQARDELGDVGAIDWLVNNAGIAQSGKLLDHGRASGEDVYDKHLAVNFHGPRWVIEALLPAMIVEGYGRIVNMASSAGLRGYAYVAAYCASKHALMGYSASAAQELARTGVTLNVVCPHYVDSPMTEASVDNITARTGQTPDEVRAFLASQNPGGELVTVDEVADEVVALLSGDTNGAVVELQGGGRRDERLFEGIAR